MSGWGQTRKCPCLHGTSVVPSRADVARPQAEAHSNAHVSNAIPIPLSSQKCPGLLQRLLARENLRPQPPAREIIPIEIWLDMYGHFPDGLLDHKTRNPSSCRIADLRKATHSQNAANTNLRATSTSGFNGACWHKKRNKYRTRIGIRGKVVELDFYNTAREAARAYDYVATRVFGEFARTNKHLGLID